MAKERIKEVAEVQRRALLVGRRGIIAFLHEDSGGAEQWLVVQQNSDGFDFAYAVEDIDPDAIAALGVIQATRNSMLPRWADLNGAVEYFLREGRQLATASGRPVLTPDQIAVLQVVRKQTLSKGAAS